MKKLCFYFNLTKEILFQTVVFTIFESISTYISIIFVLLHSKYDTALMFMLRLFFLCCALSVMAVVRGQERLSESDFSGDSIYVYRLNHEDLERCYRQEKQPDESCLHTFVACYSRHAEVPELPRGNYILVQAQKNVLKYDSHIVDDLKYDLLSGDDLLLYLSDRAGTPITQAMVKLEHRSIS